MYIYKMYMYTIYIYIIYIYIYIYRYHYLENIQIIKIKNNICFIKDAHRKTAPDACPETSVRVCFGG